MTNLDREGYPRDEKPLNDRQVLFCEAYLADPSSATDAARQAGFLDPTGQGRYLLKHSGVQAYLQERREEIQKRLGISPERVLAELAQIAYFNLTDFVDEDEDGNVSINIQKLRASPSAAAVTEFTVTKKPTPRGNVTTTRVKQADKVVALTQIAKHLGMMVDKVDVSGKIDFLKLIEDSFITIEQPKPVALEDQSEVIDIEPEVT